MPHNDATQRRGAGRPKGSVEARGSKAHIRAYVEGRLDAYLARLDDIAMNAPRHADALAAMKLLFDRAFGRVDDILPAPTNAEQTATIGDLLKRKQQGEGDAN